MLVLGALFLLFTLSACQAGGTRPIIKIGLTAPFSGFDESIGYSVIGAVRLAVRERNETGGVGGYSIELVALDDGNEPDMAAQRAREMIIDTAVMAIVGGFDNAAAQAAAAEYEHAGMAFVTLATGDALTGHSFRLVGSEKEAGWLAGRWAARDMHARRIAIVSDRTADSALTEQFTTAAQTGGAAVVYRGYSERWQLDFSVVTRDLASASPDLVFFAGRAAEAGELLKQIRAAGVRSIFMGGPGVDDARIVQIAGQAAQGASYVSLGFGLAQVKDASVRDRLATASLRPPGAYTVLAYDGAHLVLDALERAIKAQRKPARAGVAEAVRTSRFQGLSGDIAFDQDGNRLISPLHVLTLNNTYPGTIVCQ